MKKLNKILRFRFSDDVVNALEKTNRKSDYVRRAVRKQLELDGYLETKIPF